MALTDAQKKASKKYREKVKPIQFAVQYKTTDKSEGQRLKSYLAQTGQTANAYIKQLIKRDLDARNVPYPSDNPIATPASNDNNDRLPWDNDDNATHNSGSAWDIMEQIARENGYKG